MSLILSTYIDLSVTVSIRSRGMIASLKNAQETLLVMNMATVVHVEKIRANEAKYSDGFTVTASP